MSKSCSKCGGEKVLFERRGEYAAARVCDCSRPEDCSHCGGKGVTYAVVEQAFSEKVGAKKYEVAQPCFCRVVERRVQNFNDVGLPAVLAGVSFDSYKAQNPSQDRARELARKFVFNFKRGEAPKGFILSGPVGIGKSHLLAATLAQLVIERGVVARYMELSLLYQEIRRGFSERKNSREIVEPLVHFDVVAIDELGRGRGSQFELETLDELIARRYNAGRTTLFATNYSLAPPKHEKSRSVIQTQDVVAAGKESQLLFDRTSERIYSRLCEMTEFVEIDGPDHRRAQQEKDHRHLRR